MCGCRGTGPCQPIIYSAVNCATVLAAAPEASQIQLFLTDLILMQQVTVALEQVISKSKPTAAYKE